VLNRAGVDRQLIGRKQVVEIGLRHGSDNRIIDANLGEQHLGKVVRDHAAWVVRAPEQRHGAEVPLYQPGGLVIAADFVSLSLLRDHNLVDSIQTGGLGEVERKVFRDRVFGSHSLDVSLVEETVADLGGVVGPEFRFEGCVCGVGVARIRPHEQPVG